MRNSNIRRIGRESALTLLLSCLSFSHSMEQKIKISEREKSEITEMLQTDSSEFEFTLTIRMNNKENNHHMSSKLQQAVQYNKAHLPITTRGLLILHPDASTDPEFCQQLKNELYQLHRQLDACSHHIYTGATSNALFELATENWVKFQLHPNWSVIAYRLGPSLWLIPMSEKRIAFWVPKKSAEGEPNINSSTEGVTDYAN